MILPVAPPSGTVGLSDAQLVAFLRSGGVFPSQGPAVLPGFGGAPVVSSGLPLAAPTTVYGEKGKRSDAADVSGVGSAREQLTQAHAAVAAMRKRMAKTSKALADNSTEAAKLPGLRSQLQEQQLTLEALGRVRDEAAVAGVGVPKLTMPDAPQFHPGAYPGQPGVVQPQLGLPNLIAGILGLVHPHSAGAFAGAAMQGQEQAAQAENERRQAQFREMFQTQVRKNQDDMERADLKYRAEVAKAQAKNKYDVDTAARQRAAALAASKTKTAQDWQKAFSKAQKSILPAEQASVLVSGEAGELKQDAAELSAAERGETAARSQVGLAERKAADIQQKERERKSRETKAAADRASREHIAAGRLTSMKELAEFHANSQTALQGLREHAQDLRQQRHDAAEDARSAGRAGTVGGPSRDEISVARQWIAGARNHLNSEKDYKLRAPEEDRPLIQSRINELEKDLTAAQANFRSLIREQAAARSRRGTSGTASAPPAGAKVYDFTR